MESFQIRFTFLSLSILSISSTLTSCRTFSGTKANSEIASSNGVEPKWRHIYLKSSAETGSIPINIDFQFRLECDRFTFESHDHELRLVDPVWINMYGVDAGHAVRGRIEFWQQSNIRHGSEPEKKVRTNKYFDRDIELHGGEESHYTVNPNSIVVKHTSGAGNEDDRIFQKLRFTIDDQPLKDPISQSEWFEISLDDGIACF